MLRAYLRARALKSSNLALNVSLALGLLLSASSGFGMTSVRSPSPPSKSAPAPVPVPSSSPLSTSTDPIMSWCEEVSRSVKALKWKIDPCGGIPWKVKGLSVQGRPLVYAEFGDLKSENTTLIFSTVHGNEITPLYLGVQIAQFLKERQSQLIKTRVVIAPLVNPDGFFNEPKTRGNARGVDVNRNFDTPDWHKQALQSWRTKYKSAKGRFPGNQPRSEPETLFQEELIRAIRPQKILSIHSPLNILDYDGPGAVTLSNFPSEYTRICDELKRRLKAKTTGDFPGSLGNYAGRLLGIPTVTLELPSADARKAEQYWKQFNRGIWTMIQFSVPSYASSHLNKKPGS